MLNAAGGWSACTAISLAIVGCARPTTGAQVAQQQQVIQSEETPAKLVERGKAFASVGDYIRAEEYFAAALKEGADTHTVLPLLIRVCIQSNRYRDALGYAEPVLVKHPQDHHLRLVVASLYAAVDDYDHSRKELETILATHPDVAQAHYALAVLLRDEYHQLLDADAHFREYLRIDPDGPHADEARASLLKEVKALP